MAIQRNGKLIKCPNCKSERILVIKVLTDNFGTSCAACGEKFLTGHPIIEGQKDLWNHPEDTAEWLSRGPKG
jgi:DNA-directed RNA polymerase subunit RPC12/RpoP